MSEIIDNVNEHYIIYNIIGQFKFFSNTVVYTVTYKGIQI